jgi:RNA polymerase sigma factor (sigma-70 family)
VNADDFQLIRDYAEHQSEAAFEKLVVRYVNLVYSAAMRQVKDPHLAEEVTQTVFIILARKGKTLGPNIILSGWLYRTAQYIAGDALRSLRRRQKREQEAYMQSILRESGTEAVWEEIAPLLDEGLADLRELERDALIMRYFENKSVKEVGEALRLRERAAQKRIMRSLEKLHSFFLRRGVTASASTIAGAMSIGAVQAAPANLTASAVAASKASGLTATTAALVQRGLKHAWWANLQAKFALSAVCAVVLVCGVSGTVQLLGGSEKLNVAFSSFGPEKGHDEVLAWPLNGGATGTAEKPIEFRAQAEWFSPKESGRLSAIEVPLAVRHSGTLNFFIAEDHYGFPGEKLEQFTNVVVQQQEAELQEPIVLNSTVKPRLHAGHKYWFGIEPVDTETACVWYSSTLPLTNGFAYAVMRDTWSVVDKRLMAQGQPKISAVRTGVHNAAFSVMVK